MSAVTTGGMLTGRERPTLVSFESGVGDVFGLVYVNSVGKTPTAMAAAADRMGEALG